MTDKTYQYTNITATSNGVVVSPRGGVQLHAITFNKPVATGTVTIYDNATTTSTQVIGTITMPSSPQPVTLFYDVTCGQGLFIVEGVVSQDITVSWG